MAKKFDSRTGTDRTLPLFCGSYQEAEELAGANETIMANEAGTSWAIVNYPATGLPDDEEWEEDDRR